MSAIGVTRNEKTISGALALGMHLLFAVLLIFGVAWQQKRSDAPVAVDHWSNLPPLPQPKVEAPPPKVKPEPETPKPAPRVEPKPEPKPVPKPDIALKEKIEKERKLKEQADAQKREEDKRKQAEARKREEEKKKRDTLKAQKDREVADASRIAKEREDALRKLAEKQAAERAAQASAQQRLIDDYKRRISDKIRRFVVQPPNLQGNPEAEFEVVQIPGGEVLNVKLKRSSGNSAYDAAVERAIFKAQPLPPPPEPLRFGDFRELNLKFRPRE
jgi:colicin import membrane protein